MTPFYQDEAVTVYLGDCLVVLPQIELVDHVMTDPPYSDTTHEGARTGDVSVKLVDFRSTSADAIRMALQACKTRRWAVMTCDWQHVLPLKLQPPQGWRFVRHGVWVKPNPTPQFTGDRPGQGFEAIAILHAGAGRMRWNGGGLPATWTHNKVSGIHPTGKPLSLLVDFVKLFTDEGETILDPFAGSGTTGVAAKLNGRKAILIERDEKYCEVIANRLRETEPGRLFAREPKPKAQSLLP